MFGCNAKNVNYTNESETLLIEQLSENTFRHISYLKSEKFGRVACNGMVVTDNGEALIFDTPVNEVISKELITWLENSLKCKPKGIIVTHFHIDCLGGLSKFQGTNPFLRQ